MVFFSKTERARHGSHSALFVSMKGGNGIKSCSHIFALITACVFLFCGCSNYLSLSKASSVPYPQTEYDTALKAYRDSLEMPLSPVDAEHGEDAPIVWEDTGMEFNAKGASANGSLKALFMIRDGNNNENSGSFQEKRHFCVGYRQI